MCFKNYLICASVLFLASCGGGNGSGTPTSPPATSTGVFLDSPVEGLHYQTATQSGTTNSLGEYDYIPGETVTFSVGGIILGSSIAAPVVTPLSLVPGAVDAADPIVNNIVRFLLSFDNDANPDNGISIPATIATASSGLSVDFTAADLSADTGIASLLTTFPTIILVEAIVAQNHFNGTLVSQSIWGTFKWGSGTWRIAAH